MKTTNRTALLAILTSLLALPAAQGAGEAASKTKKPDSLEWSVVRDAEGRVQSLRNPAGQETRFEYVPFADDAEAVQKVVRQSPDGQVVNEFDRDGRLVTMTDPHGITRYKWDDAGPLKSVQREGSPEVAYTYDKQGRVETLRVGDFYKITYAYDYQGRLKSMDTPAGLVTYDYKAGSGQVVRILPNGVKTFWKRAPNGELAEISHRYYKDPSGSRYALLAQYSYMHGPDGRIAAIHEKSEQGEFTRSYAYDKAGRLVYASGPGEKKYGYEYDALGNRTKATSTDGPQQVCTYDWAGRLTSVNGRDCQYDTAGNLIATTIDGTALEFRFLASGGLAHAQTATKKIAYRHDGNGILIGRSTVSEVKTFICDPLSPYWQPMVIEEDGGKRSLVVWDGMTPVARVRSGKSEFLLADHLGSTRIAVDGSGQITKQMDFDPFGMPIDTTQNESLAPGFAGLFRDAAAGVYLTSARAYDPRLGAFLHPDPQKRLPSDSQQDLALHNYCGNDPVNFVDRDGCMPEWFDRGWTWGRAYLESFLGIEYWNNAPFRDDVVKNTIEQILHEGASNNVVTAAEDAQVYRKSPENFAKRFPNQPMPTSQEWQAIDDFLFAWSTHVAGNQKLYLTKPVHSAVVLVERSVATIQHNGGIIGWLDMHRVGEMIPGLRQRIQRVSRKSYNWWVLGDLYGHQNVSPESMTLPSPDVIHGDLTKPTWPPLGVIKESVGAIKDSVGGAWKAIDDFLCPPAYGDMIPTLPPAGIAGPGVTPSPMLTPTHELTPNPGLMPTPEPLPGVLFSTTGPGKRGGRGGGITRPPSWNPPGGTGRPPGPQPPLGGPKPVGPDFPWPQEGPVWGPSQGGVTIPPDPTGPGGQGLPQGPEIPTPPKASRFTHTSPSPVGGVYLGGAGAALEGLGRVTGVRVDDNGNLLLVSGDDGDIKLPPLRLDDVVTVFRSVYLYGEAPSVTIDPNPEDPEKSAMIIRHGKATGSTYVGWILYEADRLMKGYTIGVDNKTQEDVVSKVPGFEEVIDKMFFGSGDVRKAQKEGNWERFWIVPAEANRYEGERHELTLFDVPLKVKTQKMKWEGDALVDDKTGKSSPGALKFTEWFTKNYEGISREQYLKPPSGSGLTEPVPVFKELQRIALMSAVAEKLRDQGVPMPFWMRDYEVRKVPFEQFTPALEVTRKKKVQDGIHVARIFGGVELSPESKAVKTYATAKDVAKAPVAERKEISENIQLAARLEKAIAEAAPPLDSPPLAILTVEENGKSYQAAPVPGTNTLALGPCRLDAVDLAVPIPGGRELRLERKFNSFFDPQGPWGRGWTMDLPRLQEITIPISREGSQVKYQTGYDLYTPLNSLYVRFNEVLAVPELGGVKLQVPDVEGPFHGLADVKSEYFKDTEAIVLLRKDGQEWHFTKQGLLIAVKAGPLVTLYPREGDGRIPKIISLLGGVPTAQIELQYAEDGTLAKAAGKSLEGGKQDPVAVSYALAENGRLKEVASEEGTIGYGHDGTRVASITWTDNEKDAKAETLREFEYNKRGQLVAETTGSSKLRYDNVATADGIRSSVKDTVGKDSESFTRYDRRMRPVEAKTADGTRTKWKYETDGRLEITAELPNKWKVIGTSSSNGRTRTVQVDDGPTRVANYDASGNLTTVSEGDRTLLKQQWHPDGKLARMETETQAVKFDYGENEILTTVLVHPPAAGTSVSEWQETALSRSGKPVKVTDSTGLEVQLAYDAEGRLSSAVQTTPEGNMGYNIARNEDGRVKKVSSSWGEMECAYSREGDLQRVDRTRGGRTASLELTEGRIHRMTGFDGGVTSIDYHKTGPLKGAPKTITQPNGLVLTDEYDDEARLKAVKVGDTRRVRLSYDAAGRVSGYALEPVASTR